MNLGNQIQYYRKQAGITQEALKSTVPNAVFLDLTLPDTDSLELLQQLKQNFPEMKIILLSDEASKEMQEKAVSLGADCYITKPLPAGAYFRRHCRIRTLFFCLIVLSLVRQ